MRRTHTIGISLLLAVVTAAGAAAALKTVHLGAAVAVPKPTRLPDKVVSTRRAKLAAWSAALRREAAARPPALPAIPHYEPVVVPAVPVAARAPAHATAPAVRHLVRHRVVHVAAKPQPAPSAQQENQYVQAPPAATQPAQYEGDDHESEGYEGAGGGQSGGDD